MVALDCCQLTMSNQPKTGICDGGKYEEGVRRAGGGEEAQYHHFGGIKSW